MRFHRYLILAAIMVGLPLLVARGRGQASDAGKAAPVARLQHGAPSIDKLIDEFVAAINDRDKTKLRDLRVSQDEYVGLILPGSVDPGERRPQYNQEEAEYLWGMLNGKSIYVEANLIASYG